MKLGFAVEWDCLLLSSVTVPVPCVRLGARAGGGRLNAFSVAEMGQPPLPWISVEAAGVGGRLGRGMLYFVCAALSMHADCHVSSDQIGPKPFIQRVNAEGRKWVRSRHDGYVAAGMREMTVEGTQGESCEKRPERAREIFFPLFSLIEVN